MNRRTLAVPLLGVFFGAIEAPAQESDTVAVLAAATAFVRDSLLGTHGVLVIDQAIYKRGPGVSAQTARSVAGAVSATHGRRDDVIVCDPPRVGVPTRCRSQSGVTVITFARPELRADSATALLVSHRLDERDRPEAHEMLIELVRETGGRWRVTGWRSAGGS